MHEWLDEILPHPDGVDPATLVHERTYAVRAYRKNPHTLLLRGAVCDQKPPHLYVATDPEPLTMHHMIVDLEVTMPTLEITAVHVSMETHPSPLCPTIEDHYHQLVGVSIARGYTHRVRELFGGPRGCTHTTALLQAMAPVAVQSMWSFRVQERTEAGEPRTALLNDEQAREFAVRMNLNTCHVWEENGEAVAGVRSGAPAQLPIPLTRRLQQLNIDPQEWAAR